MKYSYKILISLKENFMTFDPGIRLLEIYSNKPEYLKHFMHTSKVTVLFVTNSNKQLRRLTVVAL